MKVVEADGVTNTRSKYLQKLLGKRGLWEFYRQQTVKIIDDILVDISSGDITEDVEIPSKAVLELCGIEESEYWADYLSGASDGTIRDHRDRILYKDGRATLYALDEDFEQESADNTDA